MRQATNHDATGGSARAARLAGQDAEAPANASRSRARNWPPFRPPRKMTTVPALGLAKIIGPRSACRCSPIPV